MPDPLSPRQQSAPDLWAALQARDFRGVLCSMGHHWRPVLLLGSFFVVLQASCTQLAQSLENVSVKVATAVLGEPPAPTQHDLDPKAPVVVLINDKYYESPVLNQRSPLPRGELKKLIEKLIALKPKILVIDFDLSPSADLADPELKAEGELKKYLEAASSSGAKLVLATPFPVLDEKLAQNARDWMHDLCSPNLRFGLPVLSQSSGVVVRYDTEMPSLANVAAHFDKKRLAGDPCDAVEDAVRNKDLSLAFFLRTSRNDGILIGPSFSALKPVNDKFYSEHLQVSLSNLEDKQLETAAVAGKVVFLGGAYGEGDRYLTTAGEQVGVTVHAAGYFSAVEPLRHWPAVDFAIELAFGFVVAAVLHSNFARFFSYYHIPGYYRRTGDDETSRSRRIARQWKWGLITVACTVGFVLLTVMLSGWLLKGSTWLNPWPLLLGLLVKSVLGAHAGELEVLEKLAKSGGYQADTSLGEREDLEKRAMLSVWSVIVLTAIAIAIVAYQSWKGH